MGTIRMPTMPESADSTNAAEGLWTAPTPTTWPQSCPMFPFAGWGRQGPYVGSHHKAGENVSSEFVIPEIAFLLARTAVLIQFVGAIPAVILAVTEEPLGDAPAKKQSLNHEMYLILSVLS